MILFGKGRQNMEVLAADFLPHEKQLYIVVADASGSLIVLQFDPERRSSHPFRSHHSYKLHKIRNLSRAPAFCTNPPSIPATSQLRSLWYRAPGGRHRSLRQVTTPPSRRLPRSGVRTIASSCRRSPAPSRSSLPWMSPLTVGSALCRPS